MAALTSGAIAEVLFENALTVYEEQTQMMDLVDVFHPNDATMQNAGNEIWRPVQQNAPVISGWDLSTSETGIIEQTYKAGLGLPTNDYVVQRIDDMRDMGFWERRGVQSGMQQATELNRSVASTVALTGSLFYRSDTTDGFDFVAEGQAILNERQTVKSEMRNFVLNDRDNKAYAKDLAARQTLQGRPADTWLTGQIGANVAEFDVHVGSYLPNLDGGASPGATATGDQSFSPTGGSVDPVTNTVVNTDYRYADIEVSDNTSYNVGDKVTIGAIQSVGLADKNQTNQLMTFSIIAVDANTTTMTIWPKPIAWDQRPVADGGDGSLSAEEAATANVDTAISGTDVVARLNIDATAKSNVFWAKNSIEIVAGNAPWSLMSQFGGMKVISKQLKSGMSMYCVYDADMPAATASFRIFTWYGVNNANPSANGVGIRF